MTKPPFAYVLYIERVNDPPDTRVWLYQSLRATEEELRAYAASRWVGPFSDGDIIEMLAEDGTRVRVFAITIKHNKQTTAELQPFARAKAA